MNLSTLPALASSWVHRNIGPDRDFGTSGHEIHDGLEQIKERVDDLRKPVDISLQGSYSDLSTRDKFVLGAAGGATVGAGLGLVRGFLGNAGDGMKLNIAWTPHQVLEPKVDFDKTRVDIPGTTKVAGPNGLEDQTVPNASLRTNFTARISNKVVGEYKTPDKVGIDYRPTTNAAVQALGGAALGALVGVGATAAAMALHKGQTGHAPIEVNYGDEKKTLIVSTGVGVAVGAGLGALDGHFEAARAAGLSQTLKWDVPIMRENVQIGQIPKDATLMIRQDVRYNSNDFNGSEIYRDGAKFDAHIAKGPKVPIMGSTPEKTLLGNVKMEEKSATYSPVARYSLAGSVLAGAAVGGLIGLAVGVTTNTLKKMVQV